MRKHTIIETDFRTLRTEGGKDINHAVFRSLPAMTDNALTLELFSSFEFLEKMCSDYSYDIFHAQEEHTTFSVKHSLKNIKAVLYTIDTRIVLAVKNGGVDLPASSDVPITFLNMIPLLDGDCLKLRLAERFYGQSWQQRGGVGAFMMLARKYDRIRNQCRDHTLISYTSQHMDEDGVLDDIRDLRRYLLLVETYIVCSHHIDQG